MLLFLLGNYGLARAQTDCCSLEGELTYHEDFSSPINIFPDYTVTTAPIGPGQITYQDGTFANNISNGFWNVNGSTNCSPTDPMMLVNGRTGGSGEAKIYESTNLNVVPNRNYNVCVNVKDLAQCAFDVAPTVRVQVVALLFGGTFVLFDSGLTPVGAGAGNCDYINVNGTFPGANTNFMNVRVRIWLDETGFGDGNDIAIDDVIVSPLSEVDVALTRFGYTTQYAGGTQYNITATASQSLPLDCAQSWTVCELSDPNNLNSCIAGTTATSGPNGAWGSPTSFPGYCCTPNNTSPDGLFDEGSWYLIRRTVECDCQDSNAYIIVLQQGPESSEPYYEGPESEFPGGGIEGPNN